jgi:L-alanine-DL-glutamate epimerase-like enolase superfamily enzyme
LQAGEVVVADANTGWLSHEAAQVVHAIRDLDLYFDQPCLTFKENVEIRRRTHHPFILDESIDSIAALLDAHAARAMDAINIKISKYGGLTLARQVRDLCVAMGISMTLEDSGGGDIVTAAIAHLAHSAPEAFRFNCVTAQLRRPPVRRRRSQRVDGCIAAPSGPASVSRPT